MLSIAEWADRASALFSLMTLTSSVSFSLSIRISLRLKIHQAQAKNFCRGLDIRVSECMEVEVLKARNLLLRCPAHDADRVCGFVGSIGTKADEG